MDSSMREAFHNDIFSSHHNILRYMGQWSLETNNALKKWLYLCYRCVVFFFAGVIAISGIVDLYKSRSDFKKVILNMCITALTAGIWIKNLHIVLHSERLNKLRMNLFKDGWVQSDPEDLELREQFVNTLRVSRKIFYSASFYLLPLWLASSLTTLVWGPRALPFPVWTPLDINNDFYFALGFCYHCLGGGFIVMIVIHADLAMFSILLQIAAQYKILAKNIYKIDEMYIGGSHAKGHGDKLGIDINRTLVTHKTKRILRSCVQRQLTLMGYVRELEDCYNKPMLIQLISGFLLSVGNGLELSVVSTNFSLKLIYQVGYSIMVIGDVFMCCILSDLLLSQVRKVAMSLYNIAWYEMDTDVKKDLKLITMGAQISKPLTAGKMFRLNLAMFLEMMKNIYSWLALFRQLVIKK